VDLGFGRSTTGIHPDDQGDQRRRRTERDLAVVDVTVTAGAGWQRLRRRLENRAAGPSLRRK
jgi:hypothetical protein